MNQPHVRRERRRPGRPANGDTVLCPKCSNGTIEFNERFRLTLSGHMATVPAWICDGPGCGYVWLVRESDDQERRRPDL